MNPAPALRIDNGMVNVFLLTTAVQIAADSKSATELMNVVTERITYRQAILRAHQLITSGRVARGLDVIEEAIGEKRA